MPQHRTERADLLTRASWVGARTHARFAECIVFLCFSTLVGLSLIFPMCRRLLENAYVFWSVVFVPGLVLMVVPLASSYMVRKARKIAVVESTGTVYLGDYDWGLPEGSRPVQFEPYEFVAGVGAGAPKFAWGAGALLFPLLVFLSRGMGDAVFSPVAVNPFLSAYVICAGAVRVVCAIIWPMHCTITPRRLSACRRAVFGDTEFDVHDINLLNGTVSIDPIYWVASIVADNRPFQVSLLCNKDREVVLKKIFLACQ